MNKYPLWKNLLLLFVLALAIIYAMPNLFGKNPVIQLSSTTPGATLTHQDVQSITTVLNNNRLPYRAIMIEHTNVIIRFDNNDSQLQAKEVLQNTFDDQYIIALNLEAATPKWLRAIGANPMKLGLDLQGGVHLLLQVDISDVLKRREVADIRNIGEELRQKRIRYAGIAPYKHIGITVNFQSAAEMKRAEVIVGRNFPNFVWIEVTDNGKHQLTGKLLPAALHKITQNIIEQSMITLRKRVNELGVSEAIVQQEGQDRIAVDLPGIQDAAEAKDILGKTATLEFHLVDTVHDASNAAGGFVPLGAELFRYEGRPVLLKSRILLTGDSITNANATFDQTGRPAVSIRLGGGGETVFERVTAENVGKPMSVVYVETKSHQTFENGKSKIIYKKERHIINIATIQSALGTNFQIMGLSNPIEAKNLSLLLRAGALPAALTVIQERTVGPSMGKRNIHLGMMSITVGMLLIILFMALYYAAFGVMADIGLMINLVLLAALLSVIGATLTFPGIAGFILTAGMAVDYNVLIYERIREELRNGMPPQTAIHTGYDKAFVTIIDANVTSLIVGLILFALGTGAVKGFAIVLVLGLFTSIISSVTYTRAVVNLMYGGRKVNKLFIGLKSRKPKVKKDA